MIIPIRCFTCGKVLADKYDYYVTEAKKLSKEPGAETSREASSSAQAAQAAQAAEQHVGFDTIRTGAILDRLGLTRYCCRRHMIAHVDLIEII